MAVRTEDNKIKVFIESRDFTEHDQSDVILEQRWKLLHSNQVGYPFQLFIYESPHDINISHDTGLTETFSGKRSTGKNCQD